MLARDGGQVKCCRIEKFLSTVKCWVIILYLYNGCVVIFVSFLGRRRIVHEKMRVIAALQTDIQFHLRGGVDNIDM